MTREEYWALVSGELKNLVEREKRSVRRELDGHMEDCMESLTARGYTPEDAEARAVEVMGDPVETGRAINRQYPMFWLFFGWLGAALVVFVAYFCVCYGIIAIDGLGARRSDEAFHAYYAGYYNDSRKGTYPEVFYPVDLEMRLGNEVIVCKEAGLYRQDEEHYGEEGWAVVLRFMQYDRRPWACINPRLLGNLEFRCGRYTPENYGNALNDGIVSGSYRSGWVSYFHATFPVETGESCVHVTCDYLGAHGELDVPLEWEGVPE